MAILMDNVLIVYSSVLLLASILNGNEHVDDLAKYSYAQIPNSSGQMQIMNVEGGYSYFTDWGEKILDGTTDSYYCSSYQGFVITVPRPKLGIGDSWHCFDGNYRYSADSHIFIDGQLEDIKIVLNSNGELTYYSDKRGVLLIKIDSHNVVWYLSSKHGLYGSVWRSEQPN